MRCETCRDSVRRGYVTVAWQEGGLVQPWDEPRVVLTREEPCPDCNGTGIVHCCEGEQCQKEVSADAQ